MNSPTGISVSLIPIGFSIDPEDEFEVISFGTPPAPGSVFVARSGDFGATIFPPLPLGTLAILSQAIEVTSTPRSTTAPVPASQICPRLDILGIVTGRGAISVSGSVSLNSIKLSHFGSSRCGRGDTCEPARRRMTRQLRPESAPSALRPAWIAASAALAWRFLEPVAAGLNPSS